MKKNLILLPLVIFAVCLTGFALDRVVPASRMHAMGESLPVLRDAVLLVKQSVLIPALQTIVIVIAGLECLLFGMIALIPLLVDDPTLRREAGIFIHGAGFSHESGEEVESGGWLDVDSPAKRTKPEAVAEANLAV